MELGPLSTRNLILIAFALVALGAAATEGILPHGAAANAVSGTSQQPTAEPQVTEIADASPLQVCYRVHG